MPGVTVQTEVIVRVVEKLLNVSEAIKEKRRSLSKVLTTLFGKTDEVYNNIDEIRHNQLVGLQTTRTTKRSGRDISFSGLWSTEKMYQETKLCHRCNQ